MRRIRRFSTRVLIVGCARFSKSFQEVFLMRRPVLSLALLTALGSTSAFADLKVGYVDLQRALAEVSEGQAAKFKLKAEIDKKKAEFEAEQKKLREDGMLLDRQASAM